MPSTAVVPWPETRLVMQSDGVCSTTYTSSADRRSTRTSGSIAWLAKQASFCVKRLRLRFFVLHRRCGCPVSTSIAERPSPSCHSVSLSLGKSWSSWCLRPGAGFRDMRMLPKLWANNQNDATHGTSFYIPARQQHSAKFYRVKNCNLTVRQVDRLQRGTRATWDADGLATSQA